MPELIVLGTAASVPDAVHDTVSLALRGCGWAIPIDCGGSPLHKLARAGVNREEIRAVVLTHRHADHLYGLPMLVQGLWLGGRAEPLPIYGLQETLDLAQALLELFGLAEREGMFTLEWNPIPHRNKQQVFETQNVRLTTTPVNHGQVKTLAVRLDHLPSGGAVVYSADTEPCDALVELATGADLLIHEATGQHPGHSSPTEAAIVAQRAGVERLALIHYPVHGVNLEAWRLAAVEFAGPVILARDGDTYSF